MVLNELGQKISQALSMIQNAESIDEKVRSANTFPGRSASFTLALHLTGLQSCWASYLIFVHISCDYIYFACLIMEMPSDWACFSDCVTPSPRSQELEKSTAVVASGESFLADWG